MIETKLMKGYLYFDTLLHPTPVFRPSHPFAALASQRGGLWATPGVARSTCHSHILHEAYVPL